MTNAETVARLEVLLERVRRRSAEPRRPKGGAAPVAQPAALRVDVAPDHVKPRVLSEPSPTWDEDDLPTRPPPAPLETEIVVDVDLSESTGLGVAGPSGNVTPLDAYDSRERTAVAKPPSPERTAEPTPTATTDASTDVHEQAEAAEEAPVSSRRPVAPEPEERLAQMAFGAEEVRPPRHTPPPESGRLPAAPVVDFDADVTGVRDAGMVTRDESASVQASRGPAANELVPEPMRAALASSEQVASVLGEAQRFAPGTFLELLEATLALGGGAP